MSHQAPAIGSVNEERGGEFYVVAKREIAILIEFEHCLRQGLKSLSSLRGGKASLHSGTFWASFVNEENEKRFVRTPSFLASTG